MEPEPTHRRSTRSLETNLQRCIELASHIETMLGTESVGACEHEANELRLARGITLALVDQLVELATASGVDLDRARIHPPPDAATPAQPLPSAVPVAELHDSPPSAG